MKKGKARGSEIEREAREYGEFCRGKFGSTHGQASWRQGGTKHRTWQTGVQCPAAMSVQPGQKMLVKISASTASSKFTFPLSYTEFTTQETLGLDLNRVFQSLLVWLAAPSSFMPSQPVILPAISSAFPYPCVLSRSSPARCKAAFPAAISCSPESFQGCEPVKSPMADYNRGLSICSHSAQHKIRLTSAAPFAYLTCPSTRSPDWVFSDILAIIV